MTRPSPISTFGAERLPRRRERIFSRSQGTLTARQADGATRIEIIGEIGFDNVTEAAFAEQLDRASGPVVLEINSQGGDCFAGVGIFNRAIAHPHKVRVEVLGVAASAASIIAMAGSEIAMAPNAIMMIHNAWMISLGNSAELAEASAFLEKVDFALARTYSDRCGLSPEAVLKLMAATSWFDADTAIDIGLATEKIEHAGPAAHFDLSIYPNLPAALKRPPSSDALNARSPTELKKLLIERAGLPRGAAEKIAAGGWPALTGDKGEVESLAERIIASANDLAGLRNT